MSFGQKFKGKLVWGTSVFRILLETDDKKLKQSFSGHLTLYERRHEKSKFSFNSLDEFVSTTRELWKESLRSDTLQDTRLSRWIEELFGEMNISANYQEILKAIRGDFEEVPPLEVGEESKLEQDFVDQLLPPNEEFMSSGTTQKIKGDFDDKDELNEILSNFLAEHKPDRKTKAKSKSSFTTADGQERSVEEDKTIVDEPIADTAILNSGFNNDFGMEITDIQLSDTLPFDYKVNDIILSGVEAKKIGEEVTQSGLEVTWQIDKLAAGEKSQIEYELGKRMLRTILIRDDFDLTILQTYENINREENSLWVESTYVFQDNTAVVENVKILDQLPGEYQLLDSTPDAIPPLATVRNTTQSTEIAWSYTDVPASTQFVLTYELGTLPKILRDRAQIYDQNDNLLAKAVRILRPDRNNSSYGVIMAVRAFSPITQAVLVKEQLPGSYKLKNINVESGNIADIQHDSSKEIVWKLDELNVDQTYQIILRYEGEEKSTFNNFSIEIENQELNHEGTSENVKQDEKLILPADIY